MIEFTIEELLIAEKPLSVLAQAKVPAALAFQISKAIKVVGEELKSVRESQFVIAEKYGERGEDGELVERNGMYPILPDKMEDFNKEMNDLLATKVSLNISLLSVGKLDGYVELSGSDMLALTKFLTD